MGHPSSVNLAEPRWDSLSITSFGEVHMTTLVTNRHFHSPIKLFVIFTTLASMIALTGCERSPDPAPLMRALVQNSMKCGKDEGVLTHDVFLRNDSEFDVKRCELVVTVYYPDDQRPTYKIYWSTWQAHERKTVNITAGGTIQRVDVAGKCEAMTRENRVIEILINASFDFRG